MNIFGCACWLATKVAVCAWPHVGRQICPQELAVLVNIAERLQAVQLILESNSTFLHDLLKSFIDLNPRVAMSFGALRRNGSRYSRHSGLDVNDTPGWLPVA
jgi:hypothetical protein